MRLGSPVLVAALAMAGFSACTSVTSAEFAALTKELGRDPNDLLREIGRAPDAKAASELAQTWRERLDGRIQLALLRFGLGSDDERVVFGAAVWNAGDQLAVPELPNAAKTVIPRLADADVSIARESKFEEAALLADDPARAFVKAASKAFHRGGARARLAAWNDERVQRFVRSLEPHEEPDVIFREDLNVALALGDRAPLDAATQICRDGRYAAHHGIDDAVKARAEGLAMLPFWISELGTNCCRAAVAEGVLAELFRIGADAYDAEWMEPASARLQRTLLPKVEHLRWSRIANAYVIAGN